MSNKQALRDLQTRLAERLQSARTQEQAQSWLAIETAGHGFLLPLREAGEIFAVLPIVAVPYSQPWFLGVANLRGHLHGVVDLAAFLQLPVVADVRRATAATQPRLVGFNPGLELNCVLKIDRLAGLRAAADLTAEADPAAAPRPAFVGPRYRDAAGHAWQELRLAALAADDTFLKIAG